MAISPTVIVGLVGSALHNVPNVNHQPIVQYATKNFTCNIISAFFNVLLATTKNLKHNHANPAMKTVKLVMEVAWTNA